MEGRGPGVYVTLNPCRPELLSRAANRVKAHAETTTSDHEIARRRWLIIDVDPERPAGISATDAEHEAARAKADEIRKTRWRSRAGPIRSKPTRAMAGTSSTGSTSRTTAMRSPWWTAFSKRSPSASTTTP